MNLSVVKSLYGRYSWILIVVLGLYSLYKTISPVEVKIVKTEHTRTIVDKTEVTRLKSDLAKSEEMRSQLDSTMKSMREELKNVQIKEVIKEVKYVDGHIETITERETVDKTSVKIDEQNKETKNNVSISSSTEANTTDKKILEHIVSKTDSKTVQTQNSFPFWFSSVAYKYFSQCIEVGQGINIGKSIGIGVVGSYSFKDNGAWDAGGMVQFRY